MTRPHQDQFSLRELRGEIEKAGSSPKACKRGVIAPMNDLKSQHAIEGDGARHVVGGQRDGTDALDHRGTAPFFVSCIGCGEGDHEPRQGNRCRHSENAAEQSKPHQHIRARPANGYCRGQPPILPPCRSRSEPRWTRGPIPSLSLCVCVCVCVYVCFM